MTALTLDTTMPVEVLQEEGACKVDNDPKLESTNAKSFNDSDYHLNKDEDDVIFQKSVARAKKELETDQKNGRNSIWWKDLR